MSKSKRKPLSRYHRRTLRLARDLRQSRALPRERARRPAPRRQRKAAAVAAGDATLDKIDTYLIARRRAAQARLGMIDQMQRGSRR